VPGGGANSDVVVEVMGDTGFGIQDAGYVFPFFGLSKVRCSEGQNLQNYSKLKPSILRKCYGGHAR
jgi:hypothetical protein